MCYQRNCSRRDQRVVLGVVAAATAAPVVLDFVEVGAWWLEDSLTTFGERQEKGLLILLCCKSALKSLGCIETNNEEP